MKFRNVNIGRGFEKEDDPIAGLKNAIETNRTLLALEYVAEILEELLNKDNTKVVETVELEAPVDKKLAAKKVSAKEDDN